ncbi:MAG: ATP-binding protein, partial [Bacteroidales bacterium]|nr:ATP-binding protein [Bacteroidales bacterium]
MLHLPRQFFAYFLVSLAILMCFLTLFLSDRLVKELAREEQEKMEVWALATETLASESGPMADEMDVALILRILEGNRTIPLILFDADTGERMAHNIKVPEKNSESFLEKKMHAFGQKHEPIVLHEMNQLLYYDDSRLLRQL